MQARTAGIGDVSVKGVCSCSHRRVWFCLPCRVSAGVVSLVDTNLDITDYSMDIVGDLDCSDDGCPATEAAQATLFQMQAQQMCPASWDAGDVCRASVRVY